MKFTNYLFFSCLFFFSCTCKKDIKNPCQVYPPYKLIKLFSQKIKPETGLVLNGYGINWCLPKGYQYKNGIGNFRASYSLNKTKKDEVSLESARSLIIFLTENFLQEINSNSEVIPDLDVYPFTSNLINITIHFEDENQIDLGQGVAIVYFSKGKIEYEGYNIHEYTGRFPAVGKHFTIHEESYAEALDIVKKQGSLKSL